MATSQVNLLRLTNKKYMEGRPPEQPSQPSETAFELKRRKYFSEFAVSRLTHLRLHKEHGALKKDEGWRNVSEHCLLEAVMADILAEKLNLSPEQRAHLVTGALLHDFYKRKQMEMLRADGSRENLEKSEAQASAILEKEGYDPEVVLIANAAADTIRMVTEQVAFIEKVMYYVDLITMNNVIGSIDVRVDKSEKNPAYKKLNESYGDILGQETLLQAQRRIGKVIESELVQKLGIGDGTTLPKWIESEIHSRIKNLQ
ncbi:HD domain-containing protein [Candidatus Parcubacteria bacterium]|nr:HD domain-containing protein [Candidatus Parcubacteria bacterium]